MNQIKEDPSLYLLCLLRVKCELQRGSVLSEEMSSPVMKSMDY